MGMTWVGPSAEVLEAIESKCYCRQIAHKVGVPVNPGSLNEIYHAILEIYNNYPGFEDIKRITFEDFNWRNISEKYINLYAELANN